MFLITEFKRCRCCQDTLPASAFHFVKQKLGLDSYCKECHSEKQKVSYGIHKEKKLAKQAAYRAENKDKIRAAAKVYSAENAVELRKKHNAYYAKNRDKILARSAANKDKKQAYASANRPAINKRAREWSSLRRKTDPVFRLKKALRNRIRHALKGVAKSKKTVELVGCSVQELCAHLEKQFRAGMAWENYGPVWHVDHIRPCANFSDLTDPAQQRECFHYTNLQPLFVVENLQKSDKYVPIF